MYKVSLDPALYNNNIQCSLVNQNQPLELGLTVFILFYLNEQIAELQGDGV